MEANVFNERRSNSSRNFLGKVRVSGSSIAREGEQVPQLYTLDKRSLFLHMRGELNLKLYLSAKEEVKQVVNSGGGAGAGVGLSGGGVVSKKNKKMQQQGGSLVVPKKMSLGLALGLQNQGHLTSVEPSPGDIKPVVITTVPGPVIPASGGHFHCGVSNDYGLKETSPHLGGVNKDRRSSSYDLVEQMQYLYVRVVKGRDFSVFGGGELVAEAKHGNEISCSSKVALRSYQILVTTDCLV